MEIQELIEAMFMNGQKGQDAFERNMQLGEDLSQYGHKIVGPIMQYLAALKQWGDLPRPIKEDLERLGDPIYHLVLHAADEIRTPQETRRLAKMLFWEEVWNNPDPSTRVVILRVITGIRDQSLVPILREFATRIIRRIPYYPEERRRRRKRDRQEVSEIISICEQRS